MGKMIINFSVILLLVLLVSTGLMEKGEAQGQGCEWECKQLPNFRCWLGEEGHRLCHDMCQSEGAVSGTCVFDSPGISHHCLCRKAACS